MFVPMLSTASRALIAKRPKPEPIATVSVTTPFQLLPLPVSVTGTTDPDGGVNESVGVVPGFTTSLSVRFTATSTLLVVCTRPDGAVTILPVGGVASITNAGPLGTPLKTFDERSLPETRKSAFPLRVIEAT